MAITYIKNYVSVGDLLKKIAALKEQGQIDDLNAVIIETRVESPFGFELTAQRPARAINPMKKEITPNFPVLIISG